MLERYDMKMSCTVLRRERESNLPDLFDKDSLGYFPNTIIVQPFFPTNFITVFALTIWFVEQVW
jgi:hypothetical protein